MIMNIIKTKSAFTDDSYSSSPCLFPIRYYPGWDKWTSRLNHFSLYCTLVVFNHRWLCIILETFSKIDETKRETTNIQLWVVRSLSERETANIQLWVVRSLSERETANIQLWVVRSLSERETTNIQLWVVRSLSKMTMTYKTN
jgi:hypothetical protein